MRQMQSERFCQIPNTKEVQLATHVDNKMLRGGRNIRFVARMLDVRVCQDASIGNAHAVFELFSAQDEANI